MEYTLGVEESLRKIFGGILFGALDDNNPNFSDIVRNAKQNYGRFKGLFPSNIFQDEYAIFYDILANQNIVVFSVSQMNAIIDNNRDLILDSPYVDLRKFMRFSTGTQATDDEKIAAIKSNMQEMLEELSNLNITTDQFNSACTIFIDYFRNQYMTETGHHIVRIMSEEGYTERRPNKRTQSFSGFTDACKYYSERMKILSELSNENRIRTTILDESWYLEQQENENKPDDNALMTIGLKQIDAVMGDLRRSNMLGILGPPKGGKTRFTNYLVQRALSLGLNVCVWPLEGTREEWIAMQTAAYIARKYGVQLDSKAILQGKLETEQEKSLVRAARFEMISDKSYGRLSFLEGVCYCEDFVDILDTHYETDNAFDVIVIDSLVNVLSKTGKQKTDRISSAYMLLKAYISNMMKRPALAIVPAQLKQDVINHLRTNPTDTIDVTAGGESAETIRTPDEVLGLFSSKDERAAGLMKIYSVASRHSDSFDDLQVRTSLKCCHFYDD